MASLKEVVDAANLIVIKVGTSTLMDVQTGLINIVNLANVVAEASSFVKEGKRIILVSSGAVGLGRSLLKEKGVSGSMRNQAFAAAGQSRLIHLYTELFAQMNLLTSQILVTQADLQVEDRVDNLKAGLEALLQENMIPIVNENDCVTANQLKKSTDAFQDNDTLASLISQHMKADLLICLTDVDGVLTHPPDDPEAELVRYYPVSGENEPPLVQIKLGSKNSCGRGGMEMKVAAAESAIRAGVPAVAIMNGSTCCQIKEAVTNDDICGTMFRLPSEEKSDEVSPESIAKHARAGGLALSSELNGAQRRQILLDIAIAIEGSKAEIYEANKLDLDAAKAASISPQLLNRLGLNDGKISAIVEGIRSIANSDDPINRQVSQLEVAKDLILTKRTCPLGVLLVIFESRPDCLPQIASLAIASGNGLILKGGKEAFNSNACLHKIISETLEKSSSGVVPRETIALIRSRTDVEHYLKMDQYIDLVIPRGSNELVRSIQKNSTISVLGHADGVCHVFIHETADPNMARRVAVDSKINYPAACNAMETLLLDSKFGEMESVIKALKEADVKMYGGPQLMSKYPELMPYMATEVFSLHTEYGELECCVEIVDGVDAAIKHINSHGSHHTEAIITKSEEVWTHFKHSVASACVFHNASTRFSDGFRFGLGAEVGVSTSKVHARGPVGVDGLMSTAWDLENISSSNEGFIVQDFADGKVAYSHKKM